MQLHGSSIKPGRPESSYALTDQEKRVVVLLAEGLQHKEIADRLGCTKGTAKRHVSNIHEKCGNPGNMLRLFMPCPFDARSMYDTTLLGLRPA